MAIYITENDVIDTLSIAHAVKLVEEAFLLFAEGKAFNTPRTRARIRKGALHILPAALPSKDVIGYKSYTSFREGIISRFYLHSALNGELLAVIDSGEIGRLRTGAASGVATKYLSTKDAAYMTLFGAGYQAEAQLAAVLSVRRLSQVDIVNLTPEKGEAFAAEMSEKYNISVKRSTDAAASCANADIISTITWSNDILLDPDWSFKKSVHINAAGSNALIRAEIPEKIVENSIVVVDDIEVAKLECGDILPSLEKGRLHYNRIIQLGDIVAGRISPDRESMTLFESQGMGLEDLVCAEYVYRKAIKDGFGIELPI